MDFRSGESFTIGTQHLLADGTLAVQWDPAGAHLCVGAAQEVSLASVPDGAGGAIVVWVDTRTGEADLYAQRVTVSGNIASGWPTDGVAVCLAPGFQDRVALASDGAGGAIAVWQDYRAGSYGKIYAQRVTGLGAVAWSQDGIAVSADTSDQAAPAIVPDGLGGALIAWQDDRSGDYDLRLARLDAAGAISPAVGGQSFVAATGEQRGVRLIADAAGHATAVWVDVGTSQTKIRLVHFNLDTPRPMAGSLPWQGTDRRRPQR